jgi:hypothetical protein
MRKLFVLILLSLILFSLFAQSVTIFTDTTIYGNGYELHHKVATDYTFVDIETNYTILDAHNVTYVSNLTSSKSLIERDGHYNIGNYTTTISADVYCPSGWTVNKFYMRIKTNNSIVDVNKTSWSSGSITIPDSNHKRYTYTYNPSDTLSNLSMGHFDIDIYTNCSNNTLYYFGNRTWHDVFDVYILDEPYNGSSIWDYHAQTVNLTWDTGNCSDTDVVVRKNGTSNPTSPFDGYVVYNGTLGYFNETTTSNRAYTVFSYNETSYSWSEGLDMIWGALELWVFNASQTWQQVEPFGIIIQNQDGTQTYTNPGTNTPLFLDLNDIPIGVNTIFEINSTGFKTQTYVRNTEVNNYYNYTFLLPPLTTPGGGGSEENDTSLYLITVVNELDQSVGDALVKLFLYKNETDSYELVFSFLTDGSGQVSTWLMPNHLYQVIIDKTGYNQMLSYWTPSHLIFTKTFQITSEAIEPQPPIINPEMIHFTAVLINDNTSIQVDYLDESGYTIQTVLVVSVFNYSTLEWQQIGTYTYLTDNEWQYIFNNINRSNDYYFNLTYNNQYLGVGILQRIIQSETVEPWTPEGIEDRFDWMGVIPFGVMNFLMWLFFIAICYYADSRDAGKMIIVYGVICIALSSYLHVISSNILLMGNGIGLGVLFIIIGFLLERRK